jgi:hypothetical protein
MPKNKEENRRRSDSNRRITVLQTAPKPQELPPDLVKTVAAWLQLPQHIKAAIKALIKAAR